MEVWEYVVNSLAWSLGGLLVGFVLGRAERRNELHERGDDDADDAS